jgi:hypothetical protein
MAGPRVVWVLPFSVQIHVIILLFRPRCFRAYLRDWRVLLRHGAKFRVDFTDGAFRHIWHADAGSGGRGGLGD